MEAIEILTKLIKDSEGCKLTAYRDPVGILTIGYGCTGKGIKEGTIWTQEEADEQLKIRAESSLSDAIKASPSLLNVYPKKQAAIADFIYNIGLSAYKKSTLKRYIDQMQWQHASMEILKWDHAARKVLPGLTIRRKKEADLLLS